MLSPAGVIFEIHQGVDRGASLSWLSQYPHEEEVTFSPLTALEVRGRRIEGAYIVVEMVPHLVDFTSSTAGGGFRTEGGKSAICAVM